MEISKSTVWGGAEGRVTSDLIETLSFMLESKPFVLHGKGR